METEGPARRAHDNFAPKFYFIVPVNRRAVGKAGLTLKIVRHTGQEEKVNALHPAVVLESVGD